MKKLPLSIILLLMFMAFFYTRLCISFSVNSVTDPFNNPDNTLNILHSQIQSAILPILVCLHQNC